MIKIILAEDHLLVRNGIKMLLEKENDLTIAGEASNGHEVIALLEKGVKTDIVLADINMSEMDGIELAGALKERYPKVKVLILSMMDHEKYIQDALKAGVDGYLLKNIDNLELVFAIRHVCQGKKMICTELGMKMFYKAIRPVQKALSFPGHIELTQRELEVLNLTADGLTNQEIAEELYTSKRTIEGHRQNLIEKTGVKNTAALIQYAFRAGILK